MKKAERKEIDLLSKHVFGSASRWQKLVGKGYNELVSEEVEETVPPEKEGDEPTTQKVRKPVLKNDTLQYVKKFHTVDSVLEYMVEEKKKLDVLREEIIKKREEFFIKLAKEQADKKSKEDAENAARQVQANAAGSTTA
jgi:hypothetical protein